MTLSDSPPLRGGPIRQPQHAGESQAKMNVERILSKIPSPPPMTPEEFATARALLDVAGIATELDRDTEPAVLTAIRDGERVQVNSLRYAFTIAAMEMGTDGGQS